MFKIGEFSRLAQVSARMLRYYDQCGLLHPDRVDHFTGYRLYSAAQLTDLARIVALRDMGFGVEEIAALLPCFGDAAAMGAALRKKERAVRATIADEQTKLERIAAFCGALEKERRDMTYEVKLTSLPAETVLSLRDTLPDYQREGELWHRLCRYMAEVGVACDQGGYSIYHDEEFRDQDVDVEVAVPLAAPVEAPPPYSCHTLPAIPLAATVEFAGPYDGYAAATQALATWVEENGYRMTGPIRGKAIASPADVHSPADYRTQLQVPVQKLHEHGEKIER